MNRAAAPNPRSASTPDDSGRASAEPAAVGGARVGGGRRLPLFGQLPGLERLPFVSLSAGPSPVSRLAGLSSYLGGDADVWLKNDGVYGTIYGGNKPRKLEFVLADALRRRSKTVLTTGSIGTNHGLATALYGKEAGLRVGLLLTYEEPGPEIRRHVLRLADSGANIHYTRSHVLTATAAPWYIGRYWLGDRRMPYVLGPGGSSALAALGFANAAFELAEQISAGEIPEPRSIVVPLGTGATVAGLLAGLRVAGLDSTVIGVAVTRAPTAWRIAVLRLARKTAALVGRRAGDHRLGRVRLDGLNVTHEWLGAGFGRESDDGARALAVAADAEGLRLDPVYTGKAMAALIGLAQAGRLDGPVLYWHTYNAIPLPEPSAGAASRLPGALRRLCGL